MSLFDFGVGFVHFVLEGHFLAVEDGLQNGLKLLGVEIETNIGEVDAVDGSLIVGAVKLVAIHVVKVLGFSARSLR